MTGRDDVRSGDFLLVSNSDDERRRAALTVARHSTGVDDCRQLLGALGLDDLAVRS